MERVKFGMRIPLCEPATRISLFAKKLDSDGWQYAWFPDGQLLWRELYVTMAVSALTTETIVIGTNVTNPVTRHPSVTAGGIASIAEIACNRVVLGMGAGDNAVTTIGLTPAKVETCRKAIENIRDYLNGRYVKSGKAKSKLKIAPKRVPIYLACVGPRMLSLAGECCDGLITLLGITEECVKYARYNVNLGAKKSHRDPTELDYAWGTFCYFTEDPESAIKLVTPYCLSYLRRYPQLFQLSDIRVGGFRPSPGVYPDLGHAEDWEKAVKLASKRLDKQTVRQFAQKFCMIGKPAQVVEQLDKLVSQGIRNFYVRHLYSYNLPNKEVRVFNERIRPSFS